MFSKSRSKTKCPKCDRIFDIHLNRRYKIRKENFLWFYDAVNQFENHCKVECPDCHNLFVSPEARLFGIFKSPYALIFAVWIFIFTVLLIMFGSVLFLEKLKIL